LKLIKNKRFVEVASCKQQLEKIAGSPSKSEKSAEKQEKETISRRKWTTVNISNCDFLLTIILINFIVGGVRTIEEML